MTGADEERKRDKDVQPLLAVVEKYIRKVVKREIILLIRQEAERQVEMEAQKLLRQLKERQLEGAKDSELTNKTTTSFNAQLPTEPLPLPENIPVLSHLAQGTFINPAAIES